MRILVVEDERKVASFVERGLREEHYAVDVAYDGEDGLYRAQSDTYDAIVLDILLPKKDGLQVLRELRNGGNHTPVLILTAKGTVPDRVHGLDSGADDYLTKPFAFDELLARLRAVLRRGASAQPLRLQCADLTLDVVTHEVTRAGAHVALTSKEYALLEYFMRRAGEIVTRTQIAEHVWDETFDPFSNVIDVYVHYLREKIDRGFGTPLLHTMRGVGYVLRPKEPE